MLPLVRVGAAVSADVVTSTKLFVMRYNITSLAYARLLADMYYPKFAKDHTMFVMEQS